MHVFTAYSIFVHASRAVQMQPDVEQPDALQLDLTTFRLRALHAPHMDDNDMRDQTHMMCMFQTQKNKLTIALTYYSLLIQNSIDGAHTGRIWLVKR